ncbi:hypothetical protein BOTNAR_0002g00570 [Botryotinia narcissicola]|uniref:Zn(2)-C6 fungal-type domain-containing protein n=1 Tax=Botryotinia narcissicola TaxID=278944 RepID=A0A4Z1JLW0_9HELO|nr:hypothetical protein BOTNAR_0002g00570 [Botryotinia narcissicola]
MSSSIIRFRYGGSKVRSGCITCKARRVKCDEGKPTCQRCLKAKRTCEGYAPPSSMSATNSRPLKFVVYSASSPVDALSLLPGITPREQRFFDFFRLRTAVELTGPFEADLWSSVLLQTAHAESAIFNAVVALGALHENFGHSRDVQALDSNYALIHYQKAIQRIVNPKALNIDIVLMMCLVFSAFDNLRNNYEASLTHIAGGIKILIEEDKRLGGLKDGSLQKDVFLPMFARLENQITECGQTATAANTTRLLQLPTLNIPHTFTTVEEAQNAFDLYLSYLWNMMEQLGEANKHRIPPPPVLQRHHRYDGLSRWLDPLDPLRKHIDFSTCQTPPIHGANMRYGFSSWCAAFDASDFPPFHPAVLLLQMSRTIVSILLNIDIAIGEIAWDSYLPQYQMILDYAEMTSPNRYMISPNQGGTSPTFHYHRGFLTPIYLVSTRCRDPLMRRRALRILENCNRKEGIIDSMIYTKIAEKMMDIEEGAAIDEMKKNGTSQNFGECIIEKAEQIPEKCRIRESIAKFVPGGGGLVGYKREGIWYAVDNEEPVSVNWQK